MVDAPTVKIVEFNVAAATSGTWSNFVDTTTKALSFGQIDNSISGTISSTKVVAMSGVAFNGNSTLSNMKFYLLSSSAFTVGNFQFYMDINNTWTQNKSVMTDDDVVPTSLPGSQNYYHLGGGPIITGSGQSDGLGQWIYLSVYAGTNVPDGTYGSLGGGGLRYRVVYDYY